MNIVSNSASNSKCTISMALDLHDLQVMVINKVQELFKAVGFDIPIEEIRVEEFGDEVYLYLTCLEDEFAQTQQEKDMVQAATDIGFSEGGYENMELVLERIYGTHVDYVFDPKAPAVIIDFYQESSTIMAKINNLYNEIDNMTAIEAKQSVAELYAHLKKTYGWSE